MSLSAHKNNLYFESNKQNKQITSNTKPSHHPSREKPRRYDYLNNYCQHQILERAYQQHYDEIRDHNLFPDNLLIVEKRSNSNKSRNSNSPRRTNLESLKNTYLKNYDRSISPPNRNQSKSIKKSECLGKEERPRAGKISSLVSSPCKNYKSVLLGNIPSVGSGLSAEVKYQNQILKNQVNEYRILVDRLEKEKVTRERQISILREQSRSNELYFSNIISQLESENMNWKSRYEILNADLYQKQRELEESKQFPHIVDNSQTIEFAHKITQIMEGFAIKEFNAPRERAYHDGAIKEACQLLSKQMQRKKVLEEFVENIFKMYRKVEKEKKESEDLKSLWKWLKKLGCLQSCVKQARGVLGEKMEIDSTLEPYEFIEMLSLKL